MCDDRTIKEMEEHLRRKAELTRREFGAMTAGAGLAMLLPRAADAQETVDTEVEIATPDGTADAYFVHPASGTYPGVLVWPDAIGLRTSFRQIGRRLAESGYSVLVVNSYYRTRPAPMFEEGARFSDIFEQLLPLANTLSPETHVTDARAFVDFLDEQPSVDPDRMMGTIGYCNGGAITMRTAATRPDRIGAAASFHGAELVTEGPDSPHLLVPQMNAQYLFTIAECDDDDRPQVRYVLQNAFQTAGLPAEIEVYLDTLHGWCPPDSPVYNEAQAERAWSRMLALFGSALA